jgi:lipopolysaccharide/colanic/teichoic acid biosynthesis glycosyltransferase
MYKIFKSVLDKLLALLAILFFFPVYVIVGIAIKLTSSGPIIFREIRVGKDGRTFTFYKFRTMYIDLSEERHRAYVENLIRGAYGEVGEKSVFKLDNDPRITPLGRFLRKSSLDELPQLFNVLIGEMSLIGPRPAFPYEVKRYAEWHKERLKVKPGITGLWQVEGRSSTTFDEMVKLDLRYIQEQSIILDLKILLKTIFVVLTARGAY